MVDEQVLVGRGQQDHVVQPEPDRHPVGGGQHGPGLVRRPAPALARPVEMPGAVQPQVAVQRCLVGTSLVEPGEQVLADAVHAEHGPAGQIVLDQPRVA